MERSLDMTSELARSYTSCLINIEKILNRTITKFYNGDDINVITAELGLTRTKKNKKTLWPLFTDGVQLPQG